MTERGGGRLVDGGRQAELGAFLVASRARLQPEDVGLRVVGRRRTPGLRRQEVAELAAVSIDWYIRLEQGRAGAPGSAVLDAIAGALQLSPAEREYLHLTARGEAPPRRVVRAPVSPSLHAILAGLPLLPAYVIDHCFDILARNNAAAAFFGEAFGTSAVGNSAALVFLDADTRRTQLSWEQVARETVGALRANLARCPDDQRLREVVAELAAGSPEFATWWADQTVRERSRGMKWVRHDVGGEMSLRYELLGMLDGSDQRLVVLTPADEGAERALRRLVAARSQGPETAGGGRLRAVAG